MNKATPAKVRQWKDYKDLCDKHEALNSALSARDISRIGLAISDYEAAVGKLAKSFAAKVWFKKDHCSVEHGEDGVYCEFKIGQDHDLALEMVAESQGLDRNRTSKLMRANHITFERGFCVNAADDPEVVIEKLIDIQEAFSESYEFIRSCLAAGLAEALTQIKAEKN